MTGFFLLSGYVLDYTSINKDLSDKNEIKNFYIKRLITILPLYYVYAIINVVINILWKGETAAIQELLLFPIETLGIQTFYSSLFPYSHNGGSWFISCILICYFVYPLLFLLTRQMTNKIRGVIIVILTGVLLWSPIIVHLFKLESIYSNPFFRVLEFSIGILVAQINTSQRNYRLTLLLRSPLACVATILIFISGVTIAYFLGIPHDYMLYSWVALPCFISLLFSLGYLRFNKFQNSKVVKYLSALSFALFLSQIGVVWHFVRFVFQSLNIQNNIANIFLAALSCFCLANFLHYCVEKPSARILKEKFLRKI